MNRALIAAAFFAALPAIPAAAQNHKLIVISIDGLDSRFLRDADRLHIKIPVLKRLAATGATADVIGVVPAHTWPSHAAIATGIPPDQNGVPDNTRPAPSPEHWWFESDLKFPPIWRAASEHGLKTATIYWPTTVGAHVDFNCPEFWEGRAENAIQFDQVTSKCTPGLIDRIAKWDNSFVASLWDDRVGLDVLRYLIAHEKLDLIMVHLAELDAEQHETGALSVYGRKVLEADDELIGAALQKLPAGTEVAIVSDHGFDTVNYVLRPRVILKTSGLSQTIFVKYGLIGTTNPKAAALLRKSIGVRKSGIASEVSMVDVRRLAPDVKDWIAAFDPSLGYIANEETKGSAVGPGNHKGVHGLWPGHDSSRAIFILSGPDVKPIRLGEISMLDEAPTFAGILGIKLPKAKGTSVWSRIAK